MNMKIRRCKFVLKICFFTTIQSRLFWGGFGFSTSGFTAFPLSVEGCNFPPLTGATTYPRHQLHLSRLQRTMTIFLPLFRHYLYFFRRKSDDAQTLYRILRLFRIIFFFRLTYYLLIQKLWTF
jgi:hypothetical protein